MAIGIISESVVCFIPHLGNGEIALDIVSPLLRPLLVRPPRVLREHPAGAAVGDDEGTTGGSAVHGQGGGRVPRPVVRHAGLWNEEIIDYFC